MRYRVSTLFRKMRVGISLAELNLRTQRAFFISFSKSEIWFFNVVLCSYFGLNFALVTVQKLSSSYENFTTQKFGSFPLLPVHWYIGCLKFKNRSATSWDTKNAIYKATLIKCLDLYDISAQLKLEGWLCNVLSFYTLFNEEAPFYNQFGCGGTIL